ncbi:MAG TPA: hypothetical protein VHM24_02555 [Gemmatimonadaceae bacterium]|nr:hypothetical protein [Gemmatimonadaceae bacterium]
MSTVENLEKLITEEVTELPPTTSYLFAPLDKRAFGVALGVAAALTVAGLTIVDLLLPRPWGGLALLNQYFAGYTISWLGAVIGGAWSFGVAFCAGWLLAFVRNLTLALSLFMIRSRAELDEASDFLDHI